MRRALRGAAEVAALAALSVAVFEAGIRAFIRPTGDGYGLLFGQVLPPLTLVMPSGTDVAANDHVWRRKGVPNPDGITKSDLEGALREDKTLGYTYLENAVSTHGWWRSNNIGAATSVETRPRVPKGRRRVMIFGESFARGSRIPQSQSWSSVLQSRRPDLELVNMGVDGYGIGQAYLRYQGVRDAYDADDVVFIFVPDADLWRDINTMRSLGEGWWAYDILPRFVLDGDGIAPIPGPYEIGTDIYKHDVPAPTARVREHLRRYDRFYFPLLYESPPLLGRLVAYKIVAKVLGELQRRAVFARLRSDPDSEAMRVERRLFRAAQDAARAKGQRFLLAVLPDPDGLAALRADAPRAREQWDARVRLFRSDGIETADLLPDMRALPAEDLDLGFDRTHYGPRSNRALAAILEKRLDASSEQRVDEGRHDGRRLDQQQQQD